MKTKPIKIRRTWGTLKPVTKVKPSAKAYSRAENKKNTHGE
jgi:hypothetical protein